MDILLRILRAVECINSNTKVSDVYLRMHNLDGAHKELAKDLAYATYKHLHCIEVTSESPVEERRKAYIHYTKLKSKLKKTYLTQTTVPLSAVPIQSCKLTPFHKARYSLASYEEAKDLPVSDQVLNPTAMPVDISTSDELKEFFDRLRNPTKAIAIKSDDIGSYEQYKKGAYYTDGRIDLCKQVVGPDHIETLMQSIRMNPNITHFLLGNNIIGPIGAKAIADFIADPTKLSNIQTWYIAGNAIDSAGAALISQSLATDTHCKDLWLKRNPISIEGAKALAKMLETNKSIETLDLDNTAIMDEGCIALFESLQHNTTLKSIYLDANALTQRSAAAIVNYINSKVINNLPGITHLSLSMNRLGNLGAMMITQALHMSCYPIKCLVLGGNRIELTGLRNILDFAAESKTLEVLDIGYYKATADMGELPNSFGDKGARYLAGFIMLNTPLKYLGFHNTHIPDLSIIKAAIQFNTNLCLVAHEQFQLSCVEIHDRCKQNSGMSADDHRELVRKLKHGDNIWVIDSIYRNRMST